MEKVYVVLPSEKIGDLNLVFENRSKAETIAREYCGQYRTRYVVLELVSGFDGSVREIEITGDEE